MKYEIGDVFAMHLPEDGWIRGVVRGLSKPRRGAIIASFFPPAIDNVDSFSRSGPIVAWADVITTMRLGDVAIHRGEWPVIDRIDRLILNTWPRPVFVRSPALEDRKYFVYYDPERVAKESRIEVASGDTSGYPPDGLAGYLLAARRVEAAWRRAREAPQKRGLADFRDS